MKMTKCHYCHKAIRGEVRLVRLFDNGHSTEVSAHPLCIPLELATLCHDLAAVRVGDLVVRTYGPPDSIVFSFLRITQISEAGWLHVGDLRFTADGRHFAGSRHIAGYSIRAFAEGETPNNLDELTLATHRATEAERAAAQRRKAAIRQEILNAHPALIQDMKTVCNSPVRLFHIHFKSSDGTPYTFTFQMSGKESNRPDDPMTRYVAGMVIKNETGQIINAPHKQELASAYGESVENALLNLIEKYW